MKRRGNPALFGAILLLAGGLFFPPSAFASGFFHPEVGARSVMRGGANVLGNNDLSTLYVNVGNLSQVDGTNLYLCSMWDIFHTYYRREPYQPAVRNSNPHDVIQTVGVSSDFNLKNWTFAYGAYGPYGVTNRWPITGPQRYNVIETNSIQIYHSLAVGWEPIEYVRLGVKGSLVNSRLINYYGFSVLKDRNPAFDVTAKFDAWTDYVPSWGAGIVVAPAPGWLELGFSYLPKFTVTVEGEITAEMPKLYGVILGTKVYTDKIRLPLDYPPMYKGGIRFLYKKWFDIEFDVAFIPWSMLQYYDIDLEKEEVLEDFKYPLRWQDTWGYRLGGTVHANDHWWVHAGWNYEDAANPEYIGGTETDRHTLGFGLTARYFGLDIDFGYAHIWQKDVETPAPEDTMGNALDDGRGRYKSGYDVFATALNINLERMYYAYNGKELWKKKRK